MASAEFGNYGEKRFEGMINIPIVDDWLDVRLAGEWTKRDGYTTNEYNNSDIDGRNLWSGRLSIGWKPSESLQTYLIWEHFSENDDRLRSGKQVCTTAPIPQSVDGQAVPQPTNGLLGGFAAYLSQGCQMGPLYGPEAFGVPNGYSLPYFSVVQFMGLATNNDPYASATQSMDLRTINTQLTPQYKSKNDTVQFLADYRLSPALTFTSETGFNNDVLWSTEDYNRFASLPIFQPNLLAARVDGTTTHLTDANGVFCDPQLGCSNKILA
jgi:hypothetical protein